MTDLNVSYVVLALMAVIILLSLWKAHHDPNIRFNLYDLLLENGHVSKVSFVLMGAFLASTWIIFHLTLIGKITEGYFTIYGGLWIAPILTRIMKGDSAAPAPAPGAPQ